MANETVSIVAQIPENWIRNSVLNRDLFRYNCCGYWAYGVGYDEEKRAWLLFEHDDNPDTLRELRRELDEDTGETVADAIEREYYTGTCEGIQALGFDPSKFFTIDREIGARVFGELVRAMGEKEAQYADASALDAAMQMVLFGEVRYG